MKRLLVAAAVAIFTPYAAAADFKQPVENLIMQYIQPEMRAFAEVAGRLPNAVAALCEAPGESAQIDFSTVFADTVSQFARVHFLRVGPLLDEDRVSRLAFLPDPRGIGQRQIHKLLALQDQSALSQDTLLDKSVAVQGLTALQLIAFDKTGVVLLGEPGDNKDYLCSYAGAISENIAEIAQELTTSWADPEGYTKTLLEPGGDGARYQNEQEALEDLFHTLATGLIVVRDQTIAPALGSSEDKARPHRVPFSRSGNGVRFLSEELDGLLDAVSSMELALILPEEHAWLVGSMVFEFTNAQKSVAKLTPPLRQTFKDTDAYTQMSLLVISLNALEQLVGQRIGGALGLAGGFNALDGD